MTFGGLTSRAERGRLIDKLLEIDRVFSLALILIAGAGALMMFSIAGSSWEPWAANHLTRFGVAFVLMVALAVIDLRVWAAVAYPLYALGLILLIAVEVVGDVRMGAQRWLDLGPLGSFQPSEIMKLGLVLALGRFYHGLSADRARLSWYLLIPVAIIAAPTLLVAHQPDLGTAMLLALTGLAVVVLAVDPVVLVAVVPVVEVVPVVALAQVVDVVLRVAAVVVAVVARMIYSRQ